METQAHIFVPPTPAQPHSVSKGPRMQACASSPTIGLVRPSSRGSVHSHGSGGSRSTGSGSSVYTVDSQGRAVKKAASGMHRSRSQAPGRMHAYAPSENGERNSEAGWVTLVQPKPVPNESAGVRSGRDQHNKDFAQLYRSVTEKPLDLQAWPTYMPKVNGLIVKGVPRYTGYVPSVVAENIYGHTYAKAKVHAEALNNTRKGGMVRSAHSMSALTQPGSRKGMETLTQTAVGYTGYVPQKYVENVFGKDYQRSNAIALDQAKRILKQDTHQGIPLGERPPTALPKLGVPGYTGYFPHYIEEQKWLHKTFIDKGF